MVLSGKTILFHGKLVWLVEYFLRTKPTFEGSIGRGLVIVIFLGVAVVGLQPP